MSGGCTVHAPRQFAAYTDEVLHQHPDLHVHNRVPLRVRVNTRHGPEDEAVAVIRLQRQCEDLTQSCKRLEAMLTWRKDSAQQARQAWDARRSDDSRLAKSLSWSLAHACLRGVERFLPQTLDAQPPAAQSLNALSTHKTSTWKLLTQHLGTVHAAAQSARALTTEQIRLGACELRLVSLRQKLKALHDAVRLDEAHSVRPSELAGHPKFRAQLDAILQKQSVQQAERINGDGDRVDTLASTCAP